MKGKVWPVYKLIEFALDTFLDSKEFEAFHGHIDDREKTVRYAMQFFRNWVVFHEDKVIALMEKHQPIPRELISNFEYLYIYCLTCDQRIKLAKNKGADWKPADFLYDFLLAHNSCPEAEIILGWEE